jgi:hypothetical protein
MELDSADKPGGARLALRPSANELQSRGRSVEALHPWRKGADSFTPARDDRAEVTAVFECYGRSACQLSAPSCGS